MIDLKIQNKSSKVLWEDKGRFKQHKRQQKEHNKENKILLLIILKNIAQYIQDQMYQT